MDKEQGISGLKNMFLTFSMVSLIGLMLSLFVYNNLLVSKVFLIVTVFYSFLTLLATKKKKNKK